MGYSEGSNATKGSSGNVRGEIGLNPIYADKTEYVPIEEVGMFRKKKNKKNIIQREKMIEHNDQLQFFLEEQKLAAEERWKYAEHTWNVFKFYITLLTGAVGVIIALTSVLSSKGNLYIPYIPISIASVLIFIIGLIVFSHLLRLGKEEYKVEIRLKKARDKICKLISIENHLNDLIDFHSELGANQHMIDNWRDIYSKDEQNNSRIQGVSVKGTLIIINSVVIGIGVSSLILSIVLYWTTILMNWDRIDFAFVGLLIIIFVLVCIVSIKGHSIAAIHIEKNINQINDEQRNQIF